jgi:ATP-dependent Clp protease ATP-binding subunit ClpB
LADRRLDIELTEAARELIARQGYDPVYGARPLRRYVQRTVETRIARALVGGEIEDQLDRIWETLRERARRLGQDAAGTTGGGSTRP